MKTKYEEIQEIERSIEIAKERRALVKPPSARRKESSKLANLRNRWEQLTAEILEDIRNKPLLLDMVKEKNGLSKKSLNSEEAKKMNAAHSKSPSG